MGTELEEVWRRRSDGQLLEALSSLDEYSADAQAAIHAECAARRTREPPRRSVTFGEAWQVSRLHRRFVGWVVLEWASLFSLIVLAMLDRISRPTLPAAVGLSVFLIGRWQVLTTGNRLLKHLEVDSPRLVASFMYVPVIGGLLSAMWLSSLTRAWGKRHELDVNFLGPTKQQLLRLRH